MSKRYFRLTFAGYGGELTIGRVNPEFVEYWFDRDTTELEEHLSSLEMGDEDFDSDSPPVFQEEEFYGVNEVSDIVTACNVYSDNTTYTVTEIKPNDTDPDLSYGLTEDEYEEIGDAQEYEYHDVCHVGREVYLQDPDSEYIKEKEKLFPVLAYHNSEKGHFSEIIVVTNGEEFDHRLLVAASIENNLAEIVEKFYYNGIEYFPNYDEISTTGKGRYYAVGYLYEPWVENDFDEAYIKEVFEDLVEEISS